MITLMTFSSVNNGTRILSLTNSIPQGPTSRLTDLTQSDSRRHQNLLDRNVTPVVNNPQSTIVRAKVPSVQLPIDGQSLAELAWPVEEILVGWSGSPPTPNQLTPFDNNRSPEQHGLPHPFSDGHNVKTVMHTVDQIDIGVTRDTPHALDPGRPSPSKGVTGRIGRSQICFHLDQTHCNPPLSGLAYEDLSQQGSCNINGRTLVE